jgi:transposase
MLSRFEANQRHGRTHGRAMGTDQAFDRIRAAATVRPSRPAMARSTATDERDALDLAHGSTLARSAVAIWSIPDLPSAVPAVAALGSVGGRPVGVGRRSVGAGPVRSGRSLYRRLLYGGKKGGDGIGRTLIGKGTKLMAIADRHGLPVALWIASASPHEQKLVEATVEHRFVREKPKRLIADRGYDSDALDNLLAQRHGIELIAPHRRYRTRTHRQDRRKLRRYKRRWKIERLFAWLKNFRRLLVRWERHSNNFLGMVQLACMLILLRHL